MIMYLTIHLTARHACAHIDDMKRSDPMCTKTAVKFVLKKQPITPPKHLPITSIYVTHTHTRLFIYGTYCTC